MPLILEPTAASSVISFNYVLKQITRNMKSSSTAFIEKIIPMQELDKKMKSLHVRKKSTVNFVKSYQQKKLIEKMKKKNENFEIEVQKVRNEILNDKKLESNIKTSYNKEFERMLDGIEINKAKVKYYNGDKTEYKKIEKNDKSKIKNDNINEVGNNNNTHESVSINSYKYNSFTDKTIDSCISSSVSSFVSHFCNESYKFLRSKQDSIKFLNEQYKTHIKNVTNKDELDVVLYTQMYYKNESYNIEVYQGRFLYAELYVYFRINDLQALTNLLCEFSYFFGEFKELLQNYLMNRSLTKHEQNNKNLSHNSDYNVVNSNVCDDFKLLFYNIIKNEECNKKVIDTYETWLWFNLVTSNKNIIKQINTVKEDHYRLFGLILCNDYESAFENLKKCDFDILDRMFVAKEIIKESCKKNMKTDKSFFDDLQIFFTNMIFILINTLKNEENKIKMIVFLKEIISKEFYMQNITKFLIKYDSFFFLRYSIFEESIICDICQKLILKNNKKKILAFWKLFDIRIVEKLFNEELKLIICSDENEFDDSLYKNILSAVNSQKSKSLYALLLFKMQQNETNLKNTVFYNQNAYFDSDIKEACEKLIFEACFVSKNKYELRMCVLKNIGMMNISKECMKIVNKELVRYI